MAGRRMKPASLKLVDGNPGRKPFVVDKHPPPPGRIDPPDHLEPGSAQAWRRIAPVLAGVGCLTQTDEEMLTLLCDAIADYQAARLARGSDLIDVGVHGTSAPSGMHRVQAEASKRVESMLSRFGMSPADRSKVLREDGEDSRDEAAAFFQ